MADTLGLLASERRTTADLLEELDATELSTPSLCAGWTVRDVFAHLTLSLTPSVPTTISAVMRSGFRVPRFVQIMTAGAARRSDQELIGLFRERAEHRWSPPGFGLEAPLTDILVHGVDIRHPLGRSHAPDPAALGEGLAFAVQRKAGRGFTTPAQQRGLRFEATDLDWSHGDGPLVRGPSLPLLVALCGRPAVLDQLEGDGVAVLGARLG